MELANLLILFPSFFHRRIIIDSKLLRHKICNTSFENLNHTPLRLVKADIAAGDAALSLDSAVEIFTGKNFGVK
jgi:hypothetical protein